MSNLPPITDHAFARMVEKRFQDMSRSSEEIAAEIGCTADELCRWFLAYRKPRQKRAAPSIEPVTYAGQPLRDMDAYDQARKFASWRKAQEGAAATRRMLEASER